MMAWVEAFDPQDLLFPNRKKAWDRFQEIGLPKHKQEAFQYLPLQKIAFPPIAETNESFSAKAAPNTLIFVDGHFQPSLSHIPSGLICLPLETAMRTFALFLQNRLSKALKEETDPFALLNAAFGSGAFLYAPPNTRQTVQVIHYTTSEKTVLPRLQIYLGKGSSLELIQTSSFDGDALHSIASIDAVLDEAAHFTLLDAQKCPQNGLSFQAIRATLKRDSKFESRFFTRGSAVWRTSLKVLLAEENSEALLQGLWQLDQERQAHVHALVEHAAPHTRSRQHFKGVLRGKSRSSFEGKIFVRPVAQKTEAYQLNNNLLLSDEAAANAKPNLEIFADDVKASHGATVAQLDEESLFYLSSRGLAKEEAREWLVKGFCEELSKGIDAKFISNL